MSLATRCTVCGTVFRVVQDQLKVSEGWVRCGRCNEVFNALEGLFDLDRETPPPWSPPSAMSQIPMRVQDDPEPFDIEVGNGPGEDPLLIDKIDAQLLGPRRSESSSTPATRVSERDRLDFPDAKFDSDLAEEEEEEQSFVGPLWPAQEQSQPPARIDAPEFVRRAQEKARWHTPLMRMSLAALACVFLLILMLQTMHQFRDGLAARWPSAKPLLEAWCALASCKIEAPRRIEDISVESTALARAATPDSFKLSVALRNRGTLTLALPSVDLSLTDAAGQLVARRVLTPRDFRAPSSLILPGAESALQLVLTTGNSRVTGYTVEIFYP